MTLSVDLEKAFDLVNLSYLNLVLSKMQFGHHFLNGLVALYHNPTVMLKVNGWSSDAIKLEQGTRQGCPLSPLLYAIAIEPLAAVAGIKIGPEEHKLSLYADNIVLYISEINSSSPVL